MGSNSLTLAPGHIITYDRNDVTNELLDKSGIRVETVPGGELCRGRGGPFFALPLDGGGKPCYNAGNGIF